MKLQVGPKFLLAITTATAILAISSIVMLVRLDLIVHGTLYDYGLQFSYIWAEPYWMFMRLTLAFLGLIGGLNVILIICAVAYARAKPPVVSQTTPKAPLSQTSKAHADTFHNKNGVEIVPIPMLCNKCGNVYTESIAMFDSNPEKPRLVNICPHCSAVLASYSIRRPS